MLIRIVKMQFQEAKIDQFLENFHANKSKIRAFAGCSFLQLYQDKQDKTIFFTYSYWDNEAALNTYRNSNLFKGIWTNTKPLFNARPEAWSVDALATLD